MRNKWPKEQHMLTLVLFIHLFISNSKFQVHEKQAERHKQHCLLS
jgi:hypothetical protein